MRIAFLMLRHPAERKSPVMPEVHAHLRQWGARVDIIYLEEQLVDVSRIPIEYDLYVLKSKTELAFSVAGALHAAGATILNPYPTSIVLRDKIATFGILHAAGLPVPETFVASRVDQLLPLLDDGPLVVKPYRGSGGLGVRVVRTARALEEAAAPVQPPIFAQRYYEPEGHDRKMYAIGRQVFGVMRPFPPQTFEEKLGTPFTVTPELRDITLRCGAAFGIDAYGVDIVEHGGRPYVVDMSSFPGFKGVPDAGLRLADYIFAAAERACERGGSRGEAVA